MHPRSGPQGSSSSAGRCGPPSSRCWLVPFLPHLSSNGFDFPAVSDFWACLPFCGLLILPFLDVKGRRRLFDLDLLVLLSLLVALGFLRPGRTWPVLLIYPPLLYLAVRMLLIARVGRQERQASTPLALPLSLPRPWLVLGVAVLAAVHISWALEGRAVTDVGQGECRGR
jgi:hypothetical protein